MNVWLINPYGPLPGEAWRETRFAMMGRALAERGHKVVWWTANFCHHSKRLRSSGPSEVVVTPSFSIRLVPTCPYQKHIGIARLRFEALFALRLRAMASRLSAPQIIVSSDATMSTAWAATSLAQRFRAHLVFDVIDLCPEVFTCALPGWLRAHAQIIFAPLFSVRARNFRKACGIVAVCDDYLQPARDANVTLSDERMLSVAWGADLATFRAHQLSSQERQLLGNRFGKDRNEVFAIYAGTLGELYDIDALLQAAVLLQQAGSSVKILIAGGGPRAGAIKSLVHEKGLRNVLFMGEVGFTDLLRIYQVCDIGLCTYGVGSPVAMPIKLYDYLAAGLPVINSIRGPLEHLLRERRIGMQYAAGDADSLAATLMCLSGDHCLRQEMAQNALAQAEVFDTRIQYAGFAKLIETIVGTSRDPDISVSRPCPGARSCGRPIQTQRPCKREVLS
jgi:glycosyltransferase involved in cell wall biosynthesis